MNENNQPMTLDDAAAYAINAIAECATQLGKKGIPNPLILYALSINHAMGVKVTLDQSFAAMRAESSEGPQGG